MTLLAKSPGRGGLSLAAHTMHVVETIVPFSEAVGMDADIARQGALLHDLGKAHPFFQAYLRGQADPNDPMADPHRHEVSSLLLLPLFPRVIWPDLVEMVVAHHKSVRDERGLGELIRWSGNEAVFERHAEGFDEWGPAAAEICYPSGIRQKEVSLKEAREAFEFAVNRVRSVKNGWSRNRGLLMMADHFASAFEGLAPNMARRLFRQPDLNPFDGRENALYPLSLLRADQSEPHTLLIAPCGSGKTDYLIRRCRGRVFYVLPFQASINAMHERFRDTFREAGLDVDVRKLHAASTLNQKREGEDTALQRHPGAAIKVLTPHQLASLAFGTAGHEALALDIAGADVILDEVHVYSDVTQSMVIEMVRRLVMLDCRVHIGTATIPSALANDLKSVLGAGQVAEVNLDTPVLDSYDRIEVRKNATIDDAFAAVAHAIASGERVLLVANQVATAQAWFERVRGEFPDIPSMLVHSRFRRMDRATLEQRIYELQRAPGPCVVCATQVVEVSLDISFDRMVTEAAPIDSLVQRFGRVNRERTKSGIGILRPVHVLSPPESASQIRPYDESIVRRSYEALPEGPLQARETQSLVDRVYPEVKYPPIEIHLMYDHEGQPQMPELQHHAKSVLLDLLEIESASCIRESDVDRYRSGTFDERTGLEIPVPVGMARRMKTVRQLSEGRCPLVVPDDWYAGDAQGEGLRIPRESTRRPEEAVAASIL